MAYETFVDVASDLPRFIEHVYNSRRLHPVIFRASYISHFNVDHCHGCGASSILRSWYRARHSAKVRREPLCTSTPAWTATSLSSGTWTIQPGMWVGDSRAQIVLQRRESRPVQVFGRCT
jgi:hypothetical protein